MCSRRRSDLPRCSEDHGGTPGTAVRNAERAGPPPYPAPCWASALRSGRANQGRGLLGAWKSEQLWLAPPRYSPIGLRLVAEPRDQSPFPSPPLLGFPGKTGIPTIPPPPPSHSGSSRAAAARGSAPRVAGISPQFAAARRGGKTSELQPQRPQCFTSRSRITTLLQGCLRIPPWRSSHPLPPPPPCVRPQHPRPSWITALASRWVSCRASLG